MSGIVLIGGKTFISDLLFQIRALPGVESTPLPVVVYWKCEEACTDYRLDYRFNPSAMTSGATLKSISATVIVDGGVTSMQSLPEGTWWVLLYLIIAYMQ